jgi:hypothetical protein
MNQHANKNSVPPSVGADVSGIETLLSRNLPEVFGEGDPARRRTAIQELYTEDCAVRAARHFRRSRRTGQVRRRSPGDTSALCLYASWRAPGSAQFGTPCVGLGAERRSARVHRCGFRHRTGRQDRSSVCLPRLAAHIMCEQNSHKLLWVKSAASAVGRTLPVFLTNRTNSAPVGMPKRAKPGRNAAYPAPTRSSVSSIANLCCRDRGDVPVLRIGPWLSDRNRSGNYAVRFCPIASNCAFCSSLSVA